MGAVLDLGRFPIAVLTFTGTVMESEINRTGLQVLGALQRKAPFYLISDMRDAAPNPLQAKHLVAILEAKRDEFRKYVRGNCLVVTSPMLRAALRAALVATRPPFPVQIESSLTAAEDLAKKLIAAAR